MKLRMLQRCGAMKAGEVYEIGYRQAMALIADGAAQEVKDATPAAEPEGPTIDVDEDTPERERYRSISWDAGTPPDLLD